MQEVDAERRIQILRGLQAEPPPGGDVDSDEGRKGNSHSTVRGHERKRRKLAGEDDTDYAIRLAREQQQSHTNHTKGSQREVIKRPVGNDVPITDHAGHINLFPAPSSRHHMQKNPEAEAEAAKKKREFEDQYTMRFSNAAGFKQDIGATPWYSTSGTKSAQSGEEELVKDVVGKDVWGNKDPRRKEREKIRIDASDPLTAIRQGVEDLRKVERQRKAWREEREREAKDLEESTMRDRRERKKRKTLDHAELEGFGLDEPARGAMEVGVGAERERDSMSSRPRRHHRHRDRSISRGKIHRSRQGPRNETSAVSERVRMHGHNQSHTAHDSRVHRYHESEKREGQGYMQSCGWSGHTHTEARPGWEPGSSGRYSNQFATDRVT